MLLYTDDISEIQEPFMDFINIQNASADTISSALPEILQTVLPEGQKAELIAQTYDGAAVMRGDSWRCAAQNHGCV